MNVGNLVEIQAKCSSITIILYTLFAQSVYLKKKRNHETGNKASYSRDFFLLRWTLEFSRIANEITRKTRQVNHGISVTWHALILGVTSKIILPPWFKGEQTERNLPAVVLFRTSSLAECSSCLLCTLALYQDLWNKKMSTRIVVLLTHLLDTAKV